LDCLPPPCVDPVSLLDSVDCTSAWVYWLSDSTISTTLEYGLAGFSLGSGTLINGLQNSAQLSNLIPGTTYEYYLTDSCIGGITSTTIGPLSFSTNPLPEANFLKLMIPGTALDTVEYSFNGSNSSFEDFLVWDYGDGSPLDTGDIKSHFYTNNGLYRVILYAYNDCGVDTDTQFVTITTIDIEEFNGGEVVISPNPTQDRVYIDFSNVLSTVVQLDILNSIGQLVYKQTVSVGVQSIDIDLSQFPKGMYYLQIKDNQNTLSKPIIRVD
jgi:PKD repeat protein